MNGLNTILTEGEANTDNPFFLIPGDAVVEAKDGNNVHLKMPSGEVRLVREECYASIGKVGNTDHELIVLQTNPISWCCLPCVRDVRVPNHQIRL